MPANCKRGTSKRLASTSKPISHAVVRLASKVRGQEASKPFIHFYCPMVKGGGGDWLQAGGPLANPYFGSQMLRCGKKVHEFAIEDRPPPTRSASQKSHKSGPTRTSAAPAPSAVK